MKKQKGFTIVELLIVVVVIAILAAITIVSYNGIQSQAQTSKIKTDLQQLEKAITVARNNTGKTFYQITVSSYSASSCTTQPVGTDLATLDQTDQCWVRYAQALQRLTDASGIDVTRLKDPWARPYFIDENEGENGGCNKDVLAVYARPLNGPARQYTIQVALSGITGCS